MQKEISSQLELFSSLKERHQASTTSSNPVFRYVCAYEKVILIIIGFMVMGIISFSLGVERGKRFRPPAGDPRFEAGTATKPTRPQDAPPAATKETAIPREPVAPKESSGQGYTIQLASFQARSSAQREAEQLRKKGFSPLVMPKGKYIIVCVGNFLDKETARPLLSKLKKSYHDCFIRRL